MKIKALQRYFLHTSTDVLTISKEMSKTLMLHIIMFAVEKSNKLFYVKECNELPVIRYLILGVTVPQQLLITAVKNESKKLLVTTKVTSYVTMYPRNCNFAHHCPLVR
jgi:hypothetical protein